MWNSSQYGTAGDHEGSGGGGGFMNSPGPRGGGRGGGGGGGGPNRINSMTPCTCAELHAAVMTDDQFTSPSGGGMPLGQVTIVGCVKQSTRTATRIDYHIDDHTGAPIDVKQFVDSEADEVESGGGFGGRDVAFEEGTYVRVYGQLRNIQGHRAVSAFKVVKVEDLNEISFHMLHVVRARLAAVGAAAIGGQGTQPAMSARSDAPAGLASLAEPGAAGMSKMEQQVLAILREADCDEGVSVEQICQRLAGVPTKRVREVLNSLGDEGHIYSSTDDDHYRLIK